MPVGICPIPTEHPEKKVVGDPPTPRHSVADRHAVATLIHGGPPHPTTTTTSCWAYGVYCHIEAILFGKEFLRMAGIVQMLHALQPPYDKYPYHAHGTRTLTSRARDQARRTATVSLGVPGPCHTVLAMCHNKEHHGLLTCSIWLILINLRIV